jgi:hypothetical protein
MGVEVWDMREGLDHEVTKWAKNTKREEHEGVCCRAHFLRELRASCSSRFVFFAGLRDFVVQTLHPPESSSFQYRSTSALCGQLAIDGIIETNRWLLEMHYGDS